MKLNNQILLFISLLLIGYSSSKAECFLGVDSLESLETQSYYELSPVESKNSIKTDTLHEKFNPKQLILPGALMVAGIAGTIKYDNNLNKSVNDAFKDLSNGKTCKIDDYIRFLPSLSHLVLGCVGVKSKHNFKERLLISATSHAAMLIMGYGTKFLIHEQRPDMSNNHSFPSGHVAMAFTGAELLRSEYGTIYGIAGYVTATAVAVLRLYNNRHWFNDVLMGAGIGILSARIGNWMLPFERKLFKINKNKASSSTIALTPVYNSIDKALMVSMHAVF